MMIEPTLLLWFLVSWNVIFVNGGLYFFSLENIQNDNTAANC